MIYRPGDLPPCRIFDANGLEWELVTEIDTETGEIEYLETGNDGDLIRGEDGEAKRFRAKTATPFTFVPIT